MNMTVAMPCLMVPYQAPVTDRNSLMAVEDKLRLLGYLPHPHGAVASSCSHAALTAQAVQPRDSILMPKATEIHS